VTVKYKSGEQTATFSGTASCTVRGGKLVRIELDLDLIETPEDPGNNEIATGLFGTELPF